MRRTGSPRRDAHLRRNDPFPPRATQCVTRLPGTVNRNHLRKGEEINTESMKKRKVPAGFARKRNVLHQLFKVRMHAAPDRLVRGHKIAGLQISLFIVRLFVQDVIGMLLNQPVCTRLSG